MLSIFSLEGNNVSSTALAEDELFISNGSKAFAWPSTFKAGLSPSKKVDLIFFNKIPLKMMNNAFYLTLKAIFVLKIFSFLS